jgi:hypothetical protein
VEIRPPEVQRAIKAQLTEVCPFEIRLAEIRPYVGIFFPPKIPCIYSFQKLCEMFGISHSAGSSARSWKSSTIYSVFGWATSLRIFIGRRSKRVKNVPAEADGRYVLRPPIAQYRLTRVGNHQVEYLAKDTKNKTFVMKSYSNEEFKSAPFWILCGCLESLERRAFRYGSRL